MVGHNASAKPGFKPEELRFKFTLATSSELQVEHEAYACLDCGLVLGKTDAEKARNCVCELGTDHIKKTMNL